MFKIIDGKLYLNWSTEASEAFESDASANIERADASWGNLTKN